MKEEPPHNNIYKYARLSGKTLFLCVSTLCGDGKEKRTRSRSSSFILFSWEKINFPFGHDYASRTQSNMHLVGSGGLHTGRLFYNNL